MSDNSERMSATCAHDVAVHPAPGEIHDSQSSSQVVATSTTIPEVEQSSRISHHEEVSPACEAKAGEEFEEEQQSDPGTETLVPEQQRMAEVLRDSVIDACEDNTSSTLCNEAHDNDEIVSETVAKSEVNVPKPTEHAPDISLDLATEDSKTMSAVTETLPETPFDVTATNAESSTCSEPRTPESTGADSCTFDSGSPSSRPGTAMTELDLEDTSYGSPSRSARDKTEMVEVKATTVELARTRLFQPDQTHSREAAFEISSLRAKALNEYWGLTVDDITDLSPKFFDMHRDDIIIRDIGSHALLSIQHNLVAGTIPPYAKDSPQLQDLLDKILKFEISMAFMLTEVGHGLDAKNLETEVILQQDGSFILNIPHGEASKFVPPSMPVAGIPRAALVMTKLIVDGQDHGIRPVIVTLNDGTQMCKGVTSRLLPYMGGIQAPYAITSFDQVHLSSAAVLGGLEKPENMRNNFFHHIGRIAPGTLAMSMIIIPALRIVTFIAGKYSLRRTVGVANKERMPIIGFRTQQTPILYALAQLAVMRVFADRCIEWFKDMSFRPEVRHGFGVILKTVFIQMAQRSIPELIERCGAQGLFQHNQICDADNMVRACAISEGDALVVSIRLAVELCLGKYEMPRSTLPDCLLAKYEEGLGEEAFETIMSIPDDHRSEQFNRLLIPRCRPLIQGIGHRMMYESAHKAGVDGQLLALYEIWAVGENLDWYIEHGLFTRKSFREAENKALDVLEPRLGDLLDQMDMAAYVTAPIVEQSRFDQFVDSLCPLTGEAELDLLAWYLLAISGADR